MVFFSRQNMRKKKGVSHATTSTKKPGGLRFEAVSFSSIHDMSGTQLFVAFWRFFSTIHFPSSQLFPQNAGDFHHVKREWQFCSIPNWLLKSKGWLFWRGPVNLWKLMLFSKKLHDNVARRRYRMVFGKKSLEKSWVPSSLFRGTVFSLAVICRFQFFREVDWIPAPNLIIMIFYQPRGFPRYFTN